MTVAMAVIITSHAANLFDFSDATSFDDSAAYELHRIKAAEAPATEAGA
jgi:hypothetical protein